MTTTVNTGVHPSHQVVHATTDDLHLICDLFEKAIAFQRANGFIGWQSYDQGFIEADIKDLRVYKIIRSGRLLCFFTVVCSDELIWREKEKGDAIYLHRIVLNREFAGERLFEAVFEFAKHKVEEKNLNYIRMDTWAENEKLINYYKGYGFEFVENYRTADTEALPVQHRNLNVALLQFAIKKVENEI